MYNSHSIGHPDYSQLSAGASSRHHTQSSTGIPLAVSRSMLRMCGNPLVSSPSSTLLSNPIDNPYDTRRLIFRAEEIERQHILRNLMNRRKIDEEYMEERMLLRDLAMTDDNQTNLAAAQAEEMERLHIIRRLINQRKIDDKNMEEQIMLRDPRLVGGAGAGAGAGLSATDIPVSENGLDSMGLSQQATAFNGLGKASLKGSNNSTKKKKKHLLTTSTNRKRAKIDKTQVSSKISPKSESCADGNSSNKHGSKKKKMLQRQLEKEEQDKDSGNNSIPSKKKRKMETKEEKQQSSVKPEQSEEPYSVSISKEICFPSFQLRWEEIKNKVVTKYPSLSSKEQEIVIKGLFSDSLHAGKIVIVREGEGWSGGRNISGIRSRRVDLGSALSWYSGASYLQSLKKKN